MTDDLKMNVRFSKQRRKSGWFLVEKWEGQKGSLEYGPMPEAHLEPLMNEITARHQEAAKAAAEAMTQNLAALTRPGNPREFDPLQESKWLQKRK
jgi:hypothetical protein